MPNNNGIIYQNELIDAVSEWIHEQLEFLQYIDIEKTLSETRYRMDPAVGPALVNLGTQAAKNGAKVLGVVGMAAGQPEVALLSNGKMIDNTGKCIAVLSQLAIQEYNRYQDIKEKRQFLKTTLLAKKVYDLVGGNVDAIQPEIEAFASITYSHYAALVNNIQTSRENGLNDLIELHRDSIEKYLLTKATGSLAQRLVMAAVPPPGDSLYKTPRGFLTVNKTINLYRNGQLIENATIEGALCRGEVYNVTPQGDQLHYREGNRPWHMFIPKEANRGGKYPQVHLGITEDISDLPNGDLYGAYQPVSPAP